VVQARRPPMEQPLLIVCLPIASTYACRQECMGHERVVRVNGQVYSGAPDWAGFSAKPCNPYQENATVMADTFRCVRSLRRLARTD
jgi:hypothetical protein